MEVIVALMIICALFHLLIWPVIQHRRRTRLFYKAMRDPGVKERFGIMNLIKFKLAVDKEYEDYGKGLILSVIILAAIILFSLSQR